MSAADLIRSGKVQLALYGWQEPLPNANAALADLLDAIPPGWDFSSSSDLWEAMTAILSARDALEQAIERSQT